MTTPSSAAALLSAHPLHVMEKEIIHSHYDPNSCLQRLKSLIEIYKIPHSNLVYAALETRFLIESTLVFYLDILEDSNLSNTKKKQYKPNDLVTSLNDIEPNLEKKMNFIFLLAPFIGIPKPPPPLDIELTKSVHGRLGNYLHVSHKTHIASNEPEFWPDLHKLIGSIKPHLEAVIDAGFPRIDLSELGKNNFNAYVDGSISDDQLVSTFKETEDHNQSQ
jgi:hypothetical protein